MTRMLYTFAFALPFALYILFCSIYFSFGKSVRSLGNQRWAYPTCSERPSEPSLSKEVWPRCKKKKQQKPSSPVGSSLTQQDSRLSALRTVMDINLMVGDPEQTSSHLCAPLHICLCLFYIGSSSGDSPCPYALVCC